MNKKKPKKSMLHVEVPVPTPNKDEVLLKLKATSLNPLDLRFQKGVARAFVPHKFPVIPCTDVAGEVVEVGSSVIGGGLVEYAIAKESFFVPRPDEVSAAEGAGLPIAALTAHKALVEVAGIKLDGSGPRMNILVTAASGGGGHYAVQLAKLDNTHVTGTCGARNIEFVKSLGADEVHDYKTPEGASLKSPSGKRYDAVIHCARGIPWSTFEPNLSDNGNVIDLTPGPSSMCTYVGEGRDVKDYVYSKHPLSKAQDAWAKSLHVILFVPLPLEPICSFISLQISGDSSFNMEWVVSGAILKRVKN
ncbi:hypothetical protein K7X08_034019 [Anisodus acutangulus]|uniref:Enoyl reductase (ER) domain-containing protein n=1 Tax=Anisodus acutangulus TaxID=402998 RepID=A0A9Q1MFG5_9SOLA|nr:hypothetical protein K7X08_034019 [Anisodus acutangulus]